MYDVYGEVAGTYTEACLAAGVDTPANIAYEQKCHDEEYELGILFYGTREEVGAPLRQPVVCAWCATDEEIPF